jgi:hypothetical protein
MLPDRRLDLRIDVETNGNAMRAAWDARIVWKAPTTMRHIETNSAETGPLKAKSKREVRFGGKDRNGVIHPRRPSSKEGRGMGRPSRIPLHRATA